MKRIIILLVIGFLPLGCSNDDDSVENEIVGKWTLIEAVVIDFESNPTIDFSDENIVYNFQSDGTLAVSGGQNPGYVDGEYQYLFGWDYLDGLPEGSKIWLVKINSSKWTYDLSEGIMTLSNSYVDGPTLRFKRK